MFIVFFIVTFQDASNPWVLSPWFLSKGIRLKKNFLCIHTICTLLFWIVFLEERKDVNKIKHCNSVLSISELWNKTTSEHIRDSWWWYLPALCPYTQYYPRRGGLSLHRWNSLSCCLSKSIEAMTEQNKRGLSNGLKSTLEAKLTRKLSRICLKSNLSWLSRTKNRTHRSTHYYSKFQRIEILHLPEALVIGLLPG